MKWKAAIIGLIFAGPVYAQMTTETDRFTGKTTTSWIVKQSPKVVKAYRQPATITMATRTDDKRSLYVSFVSGTWLYLKCSSDHWLLDGQPFEMPKPVFMRDVMRGGVSEMAVYTITPEVSNALVAASQLELKVCNDEFRFDEKAMTAIRAVFGQATPAN
jgi:hypothetical protein